ncbi:hypothetical protein BG015_003337, partial [Linnemannia schmuckeri]
TSLLEAVQSTPTHSLLDSHHNYQHNPGDDKGFGVDDIPKHRRRPDDPLRQNTSRVAQSMPTTPTPTPTPAERRAFFF